MNEPSDDWPRKVVSYPKKAPSQNISGVNPPPGHKEMVEILDRSRRLEFSALEFPP